MRNLIKLFLMAGLMVLLSACQSEPAKNYAAASGSGNNAASQDSDQGNVMLKVGMDSLSIEYGRPQLKGRDMLGRATEGMVWRMGMNNATALTTSTPLQFGDNKLDAGSYTLFMRKGAEDAWHLLVNSETGQWGTQHDAAKDVAEVAMQTSMSENSVERFTISLKAEGHDGMLMASWGKTVLSAPFKIVPAAVSDSQ